MKIVKDDWEFKVASVSGELQYSAHYTVESEGIEQRRGMPIKLSALQETPIVAIIKNIVRPQVEANEA